MAKKETKNNNALAKLDIAILFVLLFTGLLLRLYKIDNPVADWHSWRQADTAAVGRNFAREGIDLLHPRYDDLGSNQTGHDNPQGYRMVEFPIYNTIFALTSRIVPFISIDIHARLISALFSLATLFTIYYILFKEEGRVAAFFGGLIYAIMPFIVYYSRVILPEPTATAFAFMSIAFLYKWKENNKIRSAKQIAFFSLSIVFFAAALLTKPTTIFYLIPILYLFFHTYSFSTVKKPQVILYAVLAIIPLLLWRWWIASFPEGIPASGWLITSVNTFEGQKNIFFKPAFFRWIFFERIGTTITGNYLLFFLIAGIIKKPKKSFLYLWILLAAGVYLFTFQGGNVQHDYYQTLILPALAMVSGVGAAMLLENNKLFLSRGLNMLVIIAVLGFSFSFSYYRVKDFYNADPDLLSVAKIVNTVTPVGAKLVTDREGDTTLLYLADRKGYAAVTEDLNGLKAKGMEYFVTLHTEVAEKVKAETAFTPIFESEKVYVFKL